MNFLYIALLFFAMVVLCHCRGWRHPEGQSFRL